MKKILKWFLLLEIIILGCNGIMFETEDAIIVEAATTRDARHILPAIRNSWTDALGEGSTCLTSKGHLGSCTSFKHCYPYFKIPNLSVWESWVLGNYDSCSYFNQEGRQAYGVCCTNPIEIPTSMDEVSEGANENSEPIIPSLNNKVPYPNNVYPNWPPPVPTHPPNHSYPTHPTPTTMRTTTTTWPTKSTTKNPSWPPPIPTHSTTSSSYKPTRPPTVPTMKPNMPLHGICGLRNINPEIKSFQNQSKIVGGEDAIPNEFPWIAVLFNKGRQFCGGSLIDNSHILTAAHCIAHMSSWDVAGLKVQLGDHNIGSNTEVAHIERKVQRVVRHKNFDMRILYHDVAILTMDYPVVFSTSVRPICLPPNDQSRMFNGVIATVIGWGSLRESGPQPATLQKVTVPIWTNEQCKRKYGSAAPGGIPTSMLCAGIERKDSCTGDSGGPLMVNEGIWTQVGVVSWGIGCGKGQYPGVYTRVTHYIPWILKNIKDY